MIIEHTSNDDYWGDGGVRRWRPGMSGNNLGLLLVEIRDQIRRDRLVGHGAGYAVQYPHRPAHLGPPPSPSQAAAAVAAAAIAAGGVMCAMCGLKPARAGHAYCSRTCGTKASQAGLTPQHSRGGSHNIGGGHGVGGSAAGYGQHGVQPHQQHPPQHAAQHLAQPPPHQQQQQQQMRVTCPAGAGPGQQIQIQVGTQMRQVAVPPGVYPGGEFIVMI